jgi:hypothetical protein
MRHVARVLKWTAAVVLLSLILLWAGDDLSVDRRMARKTTADPIETITIRPTYAIARKDGRAEFDFGDPRPLTCVHSLFPHLGYAPCWYAIRESQKPIPIGGMIIVVLVALDRDRG